MDLIIGLISSLWNTIFTFDYTHAATMRSLHSWAVIFCYAYLWSRNPDFAVCASWFYDWPEGEEVLILNNRSPGNLFHKFISIFDVQKYFSRTRLLLWRALGPRTLARDPSCASLHPTFRECVFSVVCKSKESPAVGMCVLSFKFGYWGGPRANGSSSIPTVGIGFSKSELKKL